MPTPKDICVCFKTAKMLHDAGIVVDSLYSWGYGVIVEEPLLDYTDSIRFNLQMPQFQASTAEELLEPIKKDFCIKIYLHFNDSVMAETWIMNKPIKEYYFKTKWHEKLCECYAEIRLKLKEAGYGLRK